MFYIKIYLCLYKYLMCWGLWIFENGVDWIVDELKIVNIYIVVVMMFFKCRKIDFFYKMFYIYLKS